MRQVRIYIDTSIHGPRRLDGQAMYILATDTAAGTADLGKTIKREDTTENQLTIIALEDALRRIREPCELKIYIECHYIAATLAARRQEEWEKAGWMTARGTEVKDAEIWKRIRAQLLGHSYEVHEREPHTYKGWMQRELKTASCAGATKEEKHV